MSVKIQPGEDGKSLAICATGKLSKADYEQFVPRIEKQIKEHGKIRLLFEMEDFHGWEAGALWEDVKFGIQYFRDIERLAMVGDKRWERWMAGFCRPFTSAEVAYFDREDIQKARDWVERKQAAGSYS